MALYIVQQDLKDIEKLKLYDVDGYRFSENDSNENEWVYTR